MLAGEIERTKEIEIDFLAEKDQNLLISHLYQELVRYAEKTVRYAIRLDRSAYSDESGDDGHPLLRKFVADDGANPLSILAARGDTSWRDINPGRHDSLAGAYVHLLESFDNRMKMVADHLLISLSYSYRCCARARMFAEKQRPIPLSLPDCQDDFFPKAWRKFRIWKTPRQLSFDFDEEPALSLPSRIE
ncbi:hypothetical protein [Noviherbaspirillum sedimenti]|nr:hypothetical protein [Noviherbaspirillum sedimenti]